MGMGGLATVEAEIFIEAPPELVWELVTDIVLMGEWSPEYDGGEWLDGGSMGQPAPWWRALQGT